MSVRVVLPSGPLETLHVLLLGVFVHTKSPKVSTSNASELVMMSFEHILTATTR